MGRLKPFFVVIAFILVFVVGWVYLVSMSVERTALSSSYYHGLISEVDTESIHTVLLEDIQQTMIDEMPEEEMHEEEIHDELLKEEFLDIMFNSLGKAFNPEWLESQVLIVINDILPYVKGTHDELTAVIDLKEGKERFREILIDRTDELTELGMGQEREQPEEFTEKILEEMDLPDQIALVELIDGSGVFNEVISNVQVYRKYFLFAPYVVFALLLGFVSYSKGVSYGVKWFGITILASGATFLIGFNIAQAVFLKPLIAGSEVILLESEVLLSVVNYTVSKITTVPLIFSGVGLVFVISQFIYGNLYIKK